jgi:hypothetical protein
MIDSVKSKPPTQSSSGERKLREKYGGKLAKAINRAIRAEIPGGNAALDTLTDLAGPARHSGWKDRDGNPTPEAAAYFKHQRLVVDKMEDAIRSKWGIPTAQKQSMPASKQKPNRRGRPNPRPSHRRSTPRG